ncbi:MAG: recombinase family protein [Streptosporangiaceae bacterium]
MVIQSTGSAYSAYSAVSPAGRMMVQMLGVFAEFERATIVDRVIAGMERKAARGGWCGGSRPFGYLPDPATGFLVPLENEAPLVPRYAHSREGARSVANWLNDAGHRTKTGQPWSHASVLTLLRNPVYIGQVYFRGALHPAPHEHLVEVKLFDRVQALLNERGEDYSKRVSATSDYLLAGLVICEHCGKHFVGNSAVGSRYRYRYYTCGTRQSYGTKHCDADQLPADELDAALLDAVRRTYERSDLIERAILAARERAEGLRDQHEQELAFTDTDGRQGRRGHRALPRRLRGRNPVRSQCGARLAKLGTKITDLRSRRDDLLAAMDQASAEVPSDAELSALRAKIDDALANGATPARKALLQALVHEVRAESRDRIVPWFRVRSGEPEKVRALGGLAPPAGFEPARTAPEGVAV